MIQPTGERGGIAQVQGSEKEECMAKGENGIMTKFSITCRSLGREGTGSQHREIVPRLAHFPSVVFGYYPGFRTSWKKRIAFQRGLSVTPAPPSIQTPWDSITPWWAEMESQSRVCGDEGRSNVWTLDTTQTRQSAMMKRVAFSFPPLRPSMSSHIPFKPHCTLLHCPAWPARHLPRSYMRAHPALSPLRIASIHIVGWRTEAEIDFTEGK